MIFNARAVEAKPMLDDDTLSRMKFWQIMVRNFITSLLTKPLREQFNNNNNIIIVYIEIFRKN